MRYNGRNAVVLGLGLTGFSLARHLALRGARVRVADTRERPPFAQRLASELPDVPLACGEFDEATFDGADLMAISPGVAKDQPAIAGAAARGAELVGDVELFARALPPTQKVLAITGTNGKTTATALTGELTRAAGLATVVAGNIGDAVLDVLDAFSPADGTGKPWPDVFVLELSSFQLETTQTLSPLAAAVLNVSPNHMDRYPGLADYAAAKARIFEHADVQVLNRDDPIVRLMRRPGRTAQTFGAGVPVSEEAWGLVDRGDDAGGAWLARGGALLAPVRDLALVGRHNALNALAALALTSAVAKIDRDVIAALARFRGLPHRMQRIGDADGVLYVNDSKGTTVTATQAALDGLARPVVLIAGGDGKGQDFRPLRASVQARCRAVLLIGRDAPLIERALEGSGVHVEALATLDRAVARAVALARPGDAVLLSPACASLDQFESYVARGEAFVRLVHEHAKDGVHA
jgi:UDP-N-acetylmuramoylalanine--D-glutamate ligase